MLGSTCCSALALASGKLPRTFLQFGSMSQLVAVVIAPNAEGGGNPPQAARGNKNLACWLEVGSVGSSKLWTSNALGTDSQYF